MNDRKKTSSKTTEATTVQSTLLYRGHTRNDVNTIYYVSFIFLLADLQRDISHKGNSWTIHSTIILFFVLQYHEYCNTLGTCTSLAASHTSIAQCQQTQHLSQRFGPFQYFVDTSQKLSL